MGSPRWTCARHYYRDHLVVLLLRGSQGHAVNANGSFSGVLQNSFRSFIVARLLSMTLAVAGVEWER